MTSLSGRALIGVVVAGERGAALVRNLERHGYPTAVLPGPLTAAPSTFVARLAVPRTIVLADLADDDTETVLADLIPLLDREDLIADAGNNLENERCVSALSGSGVLLAPCTITGDAATIERGPSYLVSGNLSAHLRLRLGRADVGATMLAAARPGSRVKETLRNACSAS